MSAKDKLRKFRENETFRCLFQPPTQEVLGKDYRLKGAWNCEVFKNGNPIILELGCGKGEYTISLAQKFPDKNFIGIDIKGARLWKGAKYAEERRMQNAAFIRTRVEFIESLFARNEIAEIWITFPDPQIKKARKRLTSVSFLNRYKNFLVPDGVVHLKTDSRFLHEYTAALARRNGLTVLEAETDIYGSCRADDILSIRTFYETYFLAKGFPITYLKFRIDNTEPLTEPVWDKEYWEKEEMKGREFNPANKGYPAATGR